MFRFAFGHLGGFLEFQTALFAVEPKESQDRFGMSGKIRQRFLYRYRQRSKLLEVLVVRCPLFRLLPQIFNGIVVRRIRWQWMHRETIGMRGKKLLSRLAAVIPCPIMDEKEMLVRVRQDHLHECLATFRGEPPLDALREQTPGVIFNGTKHLVAFPLATGGHLRLMAPTCPSVTQRAPLRKTRFILKQNQAFTTLGGTDNRGPFFLQPGLAARGIEVVRHKPGLLKRKPQVVQQRTHILAVVEHTKFAPDQYSDEDRSPTGGLTAHHQWPCLNQLHQALLLLGTQLRSATAAMAIDQAGHPIQQKCLLPVVDTGSTESPALAQHRHGPVMHKQVEQHGGPSHQTDIIAPIGVLQTAVEVFDGCATELYPDAHGCLLLSRYVAIVLGEIHPFAHGGQSEISAPFKFQLTVPRKPLVVIG